MADYDFGLDNSDLAAKYDELSAHFQFQSGKELIRKLGISNGESVLDVGAGTGALAEYVADIVGPVGRVHGIDPLQERISIAGQRERPQLTFEVGNAYDLDEFSDHSFDVIYLNAVFHWLPEKSRPLKSFHRLLKPGGRLGIWTISRTHPSTIRVIKDQVFSDPIYGNAVRAEESGPQPLDSEELLRALEDAGFRDRTIDLVENEAYLPDGNAVIDFIEASSFGNFLSRLQGDILSSAREKIRHKLDSTRTSAGVALGGKSLLAIATK